MNINKAFSEPSHAVCFEYAFIIQTYNAHNIYHMKFWNGAIPYYLLLIRFANSSGNWNIHPMWRFDLPVNAMCSIRLMSSFLSIIVLIFFLVKPYSVDSLSCYLFSEARTAICSFSSMAVFSFFGLFASIKTERIFISTSTNGSFYTFIASSTFCHIDNFN